MIDAKETAVGETPKRAIKEELPTETNNNHSRTRRGRDVTSAAQSRPTEAEEQPLKREVRKDLSKSAPAKRYTPQERERKLNEIKQLTDSGVSIRRAVKEVGITEQTYYQWKRRPDYERDVRNGDVDLEALERENLRLKKLLVKKLASENMELKKKLGIHD